MAAYNSLTGNDNAYDAGANSSYGKYGSLTGHQAGTKATKGVMGAANWKQQRNQRLAEQTWRAQEQRKWWADQGRDAGNEALNAAQWAGQVGYDKGIGALNRWGDQISSNYEKGRGVFEQYGNEAMERYNQQVADGDMASNYLMQNYQNPDFYKSWGEGEGNALGSNYADNLAQKQTLARYNAGGSGGIEAQTAGLLANQRSAIERQERMYGRGQDALGWASGIRNQGLQGRNAQANLGASMGQWLGNSWQSQTGDQGQLANSLYNAEVNKGMFNSNMEGARGQLASQYASFIGNQGRGDFDWWKNNENVDNQITRSVLDQERVRNQMLAAQEKSQNSLMNLAGPLAKVAGSYFSGGFVG